MIKNIFTFLFSILIVPSFFSQNLLINGNFESGGNGIGFNINDTNYICINHYLRSWSELIHKIKHHKRLESHHKYVFSEFSDDGFGLSKDSNFKRDIDILKLLSIKKFKEPIIHENDDEEEQVKKLLNN